MDETTKTKKPRGFAAMDPKRREELARKGGQAVHAKGTGHKWTKDEARAAGKLGVEAREKARATEQRDGGAV